MRIVLICIIIHLHTIAAIAQFTDSTHYQVSYAATGILNRTQNANSFVLNNVLKANANKNDIAVNSTHSWIYGRQGGKLSNNDIASTIDLNYRKDSSRFTYWALGNFDKSYSLSINHRLQFGAGISYDIFRKHGDRLNISNGLLYESSNLKLSDTIQDVYQTWRNSLRLRFTLHIKELITLDGTHFLQNSLANKTDYIIKSNTTLSVKIYRWVSFTTALTYNKLNRLRRENLLLTIGLAFDKYF